jgi:predicted CoA-binding protein
MVGVESPGRPSYGVMRILQDHGFRPAGQSAITGEPVHGEFVRATSANRHPDDIVDIFAG